MNKFELVSKVAAVTGKTKRDTEEIITATLDVIIDSLAEGEDIKLLGFGQFIVKERAARIGRNPKTNEEMVIPAMKRPVFVPGKLLKDAVTERA